MSTPLSYRNIMGLSEYMNFEFEPNRIFFYVLVMFLYSIFPVFIFFKILFFFIKNQAKLKKNILRIEIFYSFLLMQFWNIMLVIGDFAMFRIPYSTLLTRFYVTENPQYLLKTIVFFYFWSTYASQLFTVLFCGVRVALLYSATQKATLKITKYLPPIIIICGLLAALPHFSTDSYCLQLIEPFVYGSVLIISKFHSTNPYVVYINSYIYLSVTITITVLNLMMMFKVRQKKYLGFQRSAHQAAKIERTLTGTMIILLFPMIVSLFISFGEIYRIASFSYILLIRPIFLDARVHIVTCYFYFTHPIFKRGSPQSSVSHMSRVTL